MAQPGSSLLLEVSNLKNKEVDHAHISFVVMSMNDALSSNKQACKYIFVLIFATNKSQQVMKFSVDNLKIGDS